MGVSRAFHFSTVAWGPWHIGVFLDVNLPSLLASGNLEAFAKLHKVTYRIQTSHEDIGRIEASPAYRRASQIVECQIIGCTIPKAVSPIAMHHILWRRGIDDARLAGAMVLLVPPDVIWSNGSFGHVAGLAAEGKTAIFMTYMRVVSETAVPVVIRCFRDAATGIIDAPSRALVDVAMRHIHPLTLTYRRDSTNFPIHPEFILWPVEQEGYLMRVLVREMFAYDPRRFDLNEQSLLAHRPDLAEVHYITDSDDLFSLSLAPLMKDIEWYARPQRLDPLTVASWWLRYDSPANDLVASHSFSIHRHEPTPEKWRAARLRSDILMQRLTGTREILRILGALAASNLSHGEQVLAAALMETKLARFIRPGTKVTILLPEAAATYRWLFEEDLRSPHAGEARRFLHLLLDHVVLSHVDLVAGQDATLTTARGATRQLTWRDNVPLIDSVEVQQPGFALGKYWCYQILTPLPPVSTSDVSHAPEHLRHERQLRARLADSESETGLSYLQTYEQARRYRARRVLILLPRLLDMLEAEDQIAVVDGGAREVDRDPRWQPFPPGRLRFYGFEPDAGEAKRLSGLSQPDGFHTEFFPAGLWGSTGKVTFEHNNIGGGSSFLRQKRAVTDRWKFENPTQVSMAREIFRPVGYEEIDVVSLEDWAANAGVREIDFLKLNVQGGELEILRGAGAKLEGILGIMIEVAFVESYESRPMFSDIDCFLRQAGFTFFDLLAHHYVGRADSPVAAQHLSIVEPKLGQLVSNWGQLIEGHALYLRDPIDGGTEAAGSLRRVVKLAAIAEAYGQIEFAFELLKWLSQRPDIVDSPEGGRLRQILQDCREEYRRHIRSDVPRS